MNEAEIRRIIREEVARAVRKIADQAERYPSYDSDTIEDKAAYMLRDVARDVVDDMQEGGE